MFKLSKEPVRVSDHAVLRYLERAVGLNIEMVREHIASICQGPASIGASCVRSEGVRFEINGNVIVTTALDLGAQPSRTGQARNSAIAARKKREQCESSP
jgi:hypothetical protein